MTAMTSTTACWRVYWGNPYTLPPDGGPQELYRQEVPWGPGDDKRPPETVQRYWREAPAGYVIGWEMPPSVQPGRRWSRERKQRARRARVEARIRAKYPLFAEEFLRREEARAPLP